MRVGLTCSAVAPQESVRPPSLSEFSMLGVWCQGNVGKARTRSQFVPLGEGRRARNCTTTQSNYWIQKCFPKLILAGAMYSLEGKLWPTWIAYSKAEILVNKGPSSQGYGFSSGHVWMWEFNYKESWVEKNWCFWTVVLEKTLESPLDCKDIQPVHPKGDQSWVFIGRTDAETETPILWPPDVKGWLIWKDPDAGKDWG